MKNLIFRAALLTGLAGHAWAGTFSDQFLSLNPAYWTVIQSTPGLYSVNVVTNGLALSKTGPKPGGLQDVAITLNLAALGGNVSGDFSAQINFTNAVIGPNVDQVQLNATFPGDSPFDDVYDLSSGRNVHVWNGSINNPITETVTYGTFTISRTGSTLTGYFNGIAIFSESDSSALTNVSFCLQNQPGSDDYPSVIFNNFSFTAASVPGTTYFWNGAVSNDWFNTGNWTPASTPGPLDTAVITNGSPVVGTATIVGSVNLAGNATLYATAGLTVSNQFNWLGGGVIGQLTMASTATLLLNDPGNSLSLSGATIINNGAAVWTGGTLVCDSNTIVTNNGNWRAETDDQFSSPGGAGAVFYNAGAFTKSPSTGTSSFSGVAFDNSGEVNVFSGTLAVGSGGILGGSFLASNNATINFSGGGLLSGLFTAESGAGITLTGGAFTDDNAVFNGPGANSMTGGTLLLTNDVSQNLRLAGGTVTLGPQFQENGNITDLTIAGATLIGTNSVVGTFNWTGGAVDGAVTVAQNGVVYLSGSEDLYLHGAMTNEGTVIWNGSSDWHLDNHNGAGGCINNLATGVIDAQCDQTMYADFGGEWFNNAGRFQKSMGTNLTMVQETFTNLGVVEVLTGSMEFNAGSFGGVFIATNGTALTLDDGGIVSGAFSAGFGAVIDLAGGTFTQTPSVSFGGAGLCEQTGGTLTLLNTSIPNLQLNGGTVYLAPGFEGGVINNLTITNQTLEGTNTVTGILTIGGLDSSVAGPLTVAAGGVLNVNGPYLYGPIIVNAGGTVNWNGGDAESWVVIASNGVLNVTGATSAIVFHAMVTNAGTVNWNNGSFELVDNAGFYNLAGAVFNINLPQAGSESLYTDYGGEFFNNAGLLQQSSANNTVYFDPVLTNFGVVSVQEGGLVFQGPDNYGPLLGGVFQAAPNTTIQFESGGLLEGTFNAATNGTIEINGYSDAMYSYTPNVVFAGGGTNEMTGGSMTLVSNVIPNLQLLGGTIALGPDFQGGSITNLNLGAATLVGTNILAGVLTINGGTLNSGALFLQPLSTFNFSGTLSEPLTVPSNAVLNLTGPSDAYLFSSLTNFGTINWTGGNIYLYLATINNLQNAVFSAQTANVIYASYAGSSFNNAGLFEVTNTTATTYMGLALNNLGSVYAYTGTLQIEVNSGYYTSGALSGTFEAWPGATIEFQDGGYLTGSYTALPGGLIELESGVFSNAPSAIFTGGGSNLLTSGGTITLTSNAIPGLQYQSGTVILTPQFQGGSITNLTLIGASLTGTNTVTGTLTLGGGTFSGSLTIASNGVMNITGQDDLYLAGAITNAGTINWLGSDIYLASSNDFQNLEGAIFNIECNLDMGSLDYPAPGVFVNAGTIAKTGPTGSTYFGVLLANSGTVSAQAGILNLDGGGSLAGAFVTSAGAELQLGGGSFTNASAAVQFTGDGTNALTAGSLYLPSNTVPGLQLQGGTVYPGPNFQKGTITNLTLSGASLGGTNTVSGVLLFNVFSEVLGPLNLAPNSVFNLGGAYFEGPLTIASGAVLNLSGGPYETTFNASVTNQGTINWTGGAIGFSSPLYNLTNAVLSVQCDEYVSGSPTLYNAGLILKTNTTGVTTFYPSIVNTGTVAVESGEFYFAEPSGLVGGVWEIGVNTSNNYGAFAFQSSSVLTNTLDIELNNGFQLSPGNAFTLVSYGSETGSFSQPAIQPPQGANVSFNYGSRSLTLTVNAVNVPTISIVSPTNYQTFNAVSSVPIRVAYTDTNTPVLQVQYFQGRTLIGSTGVGISNFNLSGVSPGFYTLTAEEVDGGGSVVVSAPVNIVVESDRGVSYTWTGASSANWSDAGNWQPAGGPPTPADNAIIQGGPAVNLDISPTVNNVIFSGGVLTGGGALLVTNGFNWTGGTLNAALSVASTGAIYLNGANFLNASNATLVNLGTMFWTSGDLLANSATIISNAGDWVIQTGGNLACAANFINTGSISNGGGAVNFIGGGVLMGSMSAALPATNNLAGGSFYYGANATFTGPGSNVFSGSSLFLGNNVSSNLLLAGGTVLLEPAFQDNGAITNLTLSGSTLAGTNSVAGLLNLVSGQLTGQLTVQRGGVLEFSGSQSQSMLLNNLTLLNSGTVLWLDGALSTANTIVTNSNDWLIETSGFVNGPFSLFVNNGYLGQTNSIVNANTVFDAATLVNNGTIDAETGTISLSASGAPGGTYNAAAGAAIYFAAGNLTLGILPVVTGDGTVASTGASLTILSNLPGGFVLSGGNVVLGQDFQANGVITNLTLSGATLVGNYAVSGAFNWLSGTVNGSLTVASNATLSITGPGSDYLSNGGLTNFGSVLWTNANIAGMNGAIFVNNNLWLAQSDNEIYVSSGTVSFINNGVFRKLGTDGVTFLDLAFTNFGTVDAESGSVWFEGGGAIDGTYHAAPQASIFFYSGAFTPAGSPAFTGLGTIDFSGGTLDLANDQIAGLPLTGGTVRLGPDFQNNGAITNLTLNGANLMGPSVVTGTLNWLSGGIYGPLTIASNATLNFLSAGSYASLLSGSLTNFGTVNWSGNDIDVGYEAWIVNNGLWLAEADDEIYSEYYSLFGFINNGTFRKVAGVGDTVIDLDFTNNGLVDAESGTLYFEDGGLVGGAYNTAAAAATMLAGGYFTNDSPVTFTGTGPVSFQGGSLALMSDQVPGLPLVNGSLVLGPNFQNNGAITNLTLSGAGVALQGSNTVTGTFNWVAGYIAGSVTVASNALLNISSPAAKYFEYDAILNNSGTVAWSGGNIQGYNSSYTVITNNGLWLVQCDNYLDYLTFINTGAFRKSVTSGVTTINQVPFINSGFLDAESGFISFNTASNYAQTVATLEFGAAAPNLAGQLNVPGNINLDGTLALNLLDGYTPRAGDAFTLMTYGSASGAFAQLNLPPLANGLNWETDVGPTRLGLRVVQTLSNQNTLSLSGFVTDTSQHPIAGVTVYATVSSNASTNLIQNGSFESPNIDTAVVYYAVGSTNIPGWTVIGPTGGQVAIIGNNYFGMAEDGVQYFNPAPGGVQNGGGGISQTFSTTPGATYDLIFYHGTYTHYGANNHLGVAIGTNSYTFGETSGGPDALDWRQVVIPFVASSNSTTLSFMELFSGYAEDIFVDNVQVVAPDSDRLFEAVTDTNGNYQISVANGTFAVDVAGLGAVGYNDVASQSVAMSGGNRTVNFVATPLSAESTFIITTSASPLDAGTTTGSGSFSSGTAVTVTALATNSAVPYLFTNWTENGVVVSLNANYTFVASGSRDLVANFVLPTYTIGASNNPSSAGSVSGATSALWNSTVVLTATPAFGYAFAQWTLGGNVVGTSSSLSVTVTNNQTYVANYIATNVTHVVSVATSPAGVAVVSGAGTYANGQTAVIKAPTIVTNSPDIYTFQYYTLNGAYAASTADLSVVMSTLQPPALQYVAVYSALSLDPVLVSVRANFASPVPATTNFVLRFQFDRTMNTAVTPKVLLTNAAPNAVQPVVANNGHWTTTALLNDTYLTPGITFGPGMDGTVQVFVSGAQDPAVHIMSLTNAINLTVSSTPPAVAISSPTNGASFTTTNTFTFAAGASSVYGITGLALYDNGSNLLASSSASNISSIISGLAASSHALTAVATDSTGLSATSAVMHVTINTPGTTLIDFEALDALAGPVSGAPLAAYLAGYGVSITNVTTNTVVAVQNDTNILDGSLTAASSGENLLTQIAANGAVAYTLVFNPPYPSVSWTRTALLADTGGVETPGWQATAYDTNGVEIGSVGEKQIGSFTNVPAKGFTLGGADIASITFAGNNSIGSLANLPLDDLLLSTFSPGASISISLTDTGSILAAPGKIQLTAQASDTVGTIVEIDFYEGQSFLGGVLAGSSGPLNQAAFNLTNIAAGSYSFTAVATANNGAVRSSAALPVIVAVAAGVSVINFDSLNTASGAVGGALLSNYLASFGVTVDNLTLGTRVETVNGNNLSGNAVAVPSSPPNLFTQVGLNRPVTFALELGAPVGSFGFTRVALTAGPAGISHPAWTAHAFNASGTEAESVGEPLIYSLGNVPAHTFKLTGPGITRVRFDSDSEQTAAFSAVLLDDLVLDTNAASNALSVTLQTSGNLTAPANVTLSATVSDSLGAVSSVNFLAGPNLIGTVPGASPTFLWTNVLAGTYILTAQVFDSTGYARISSPVTVTVQPGQGYSTLVNFDNGLNASTGPVTGATLSNYLSGYGLALSGVTAGTQVAVVSQAVLAGGGFVAASSPPNLLTQIGGNGPASFTVQFSNWLASFTFTRPELLANPFVTHPAWQATAFDALGVPLTQAGEGITSSYTNVPAQTFTLQGAGAGIASVEFSSQGSSLTTFAAALLDNFILTTSPTNLLPSVVLTNPVSGQIFTTPSLIQVAAQALDAKATVANVSFFANGNPIGSASSSPFMIEWTNSTAGLYVLTAVATDSSGLSRTSPPVNITVNPTPTEFGIITQPVGATVAAGGGVIFSVQTTGTNAVTYQWNLNGQPLPGQNQPVLSLTGINNAGQGTYTVTASSDGQSLTSAGAVLTVLEPPAIVTPPLSQVANIGSNAVLSVVVNGAPPVTYQWTLNGTGISGATNSTYTIAAAQPFDSGNYQVIADNPVGFTESPVAAVTVTVPGAQTQSAYYFSNRISFNPLVGPVFGNNTGANATSEAGAPQFIDGKPYGRPIWYTWQASFDGVISLTTRGSSFDTLLAVYTGTNVADLTPVAADDDSGGFFTSLVTFNCVAGVNYQIDVAGFQGADGTVVLGLPAGTAYRVLNPSSGDAIPVITQQPTNQLVAPGSSARLSVTATSTSPLIYQWFFQNAPVAGASASNLVVANFQSGSVGNYYVLVANSVGSAQSANASLQIGGLPQPGASADTTEDKFGDAVDLAQQDGGEARWRPDDGGGDTGGFSVSQTFSTVGATKEAGEPDDCGQVGGASEWYLYTTPTAGNLHIDTIGSQFNTILGVYTNAATVVTFSNLVEQGCGYTTNYQTDGQPSVNLAGVAAKTTYFIVVDGYNAASGVARLNIGLGAAPQIVTPPQSRPATPGGNAAFSVAAVGTTNLSYQWRFDGVGIAGATNSSYTLTNVQMTAAGSYSVIVSNVVNAVTSAPAALTLQSTPFILVPPASEAVNLGKTADFSVSAGGLAPLSYQWYVGGVPIAKASGSSLAVVATKLASEGSYTVVVSNSLGTTSAFAYLTINETTAPTLKVTYPANNFISTSPSVTVRGTASDVLGVTSVQLLVNSNHLQTAAGTTNWSDVVALTPGTNHIKVQCYNLSDLVSAPVNLTLTYIVTSPLTLQINGSGKITGATNQAQLDIGKRYTLTATPAPSFLFSNWIGSNFAVLGTNHVLSFIMATNLFVEANFVTNPFPAVAGAYNGIFYPASGVTEQSSGFFTLTLTPSLGAYTADILLAGGSYRFTGGFDLTGNSQASFSGPGKEPVSVALNINLNPPDNQLTGLVSASGWQSELTAYRAVFNGTTIKATNYAARYTLIVPPGSGAPQSSPGGYGVATITNNLAGVATLAGSLGDGTAINQTVPISENGVIPFYVSLYSGKGSLLGWITFTNVPPQTLSGVLNWIKLSGASKPLYPGGFTNQTTVVGSVYQPGGLTLSNGTLTIAGAAQTDTLVYTNVSVSGGKLIYSGAGNPTNQLSATFTAGTGAMTLTFRPTGARASVTAKGVVLQMSDTNAAGWFPGTNESGYFLLQP